MTRAAILSAFNPEAYKGGIETFIINLKWLLKKYGITTDLHYMSPSPTLPIEKFKFKTAKKIIPPFLLECFMLGRAFSKIEDNYDIVISNNFYGAGYYPKQAKGFNIYHSTHAGYADALKEEIPISEFRNLKYYYGHIGDRLGGRRKNKIAVSNSVKNELEKYYGFKNISVVNHGIDTEFYRKIEDVQSLRKKWSVPDNAFTGIFAGRWETGKGIDIVEDAIKRHPDVLWLLTIGNSECPLSHLPNVKIIKNADRNSMIELYSLSDFMLFPSYYEGFGLVIAEALSCGLPVICTEVGIAKELAQNIELKRLIIPQTHTSIIGDDISRTIVMLRADVQLLKRLSDAGRNVIERDYGMSRWQENMSVALSLPNANTMK
jgi:glycosyltransferase involved in cell wall biosynthesis